MNENQLNEPKLKLSSPWVTFVHELEALFKEDPEVRVMYDEELCEVKLYVENAIKADALTQLLPEKKYFGNVELNITVVPSNDAETPVDLICRAFDGNPVLSHVRTVDSIIGSFNYVVFRNEVVQFFNDQLDDVCGNKSTLYQEIAKDVFGTKDGLFFCTDTPGGLTDSPLGEWP